MREQMSAEELLERLTEDELVSELMYRDGVEFDWLDRGKVQERTFCGPGVVLFVPDGC